jgi:hypothetical protein
MATAFTNPLDSIKVASPCSANWDEMVGNNRERFCGQCQLSVYNLSGMTKGEAENLIMNSEGRVCARFFRRADGTIITKDCPVGWAAIKQRMSKVWTAVASVLITAIGSIGVTTYLSQTEKQNTTTGVIATEPYSEPYGEPLMGDVAIEDNSNQALMGNVAIDANENHEAVMGKMVLTEK